MGRGIIFLTIVMLLGCTPNRVLTSKTDYNREVNLQNINSDFLYQQSVNWLESNFEPSYRNALDTDVPHKVVRSVIYYRFINEGFYHIQKESILIKCSDQVVNVSFSEPLLTKIRGGLMEDNLIHRPKSLNYSSPSSSEMMLVEKNRDKLISSLSDFILDSDYPSY